MVVKRASKTTLQRLTKMAKRDNYSMNQYTLLLDLVNNAENVLDCGNDGFVLEWGSYQNGHYQIDHEGSHKITYIVAEVEKDIFMAYCQNMVASWCLRLLRMAIDSC